MLWSLVLSTRQVEVERSEVSHRALPLLMKALPWVGHPPTRNRGTVGGSIANADPSAEIPLVAITLGAEIEIESRSGARRCRPTNSSSGRCSPR
jgi:CO/xanthine dehydrogenase FAD-binding subunit